jgi:hypothetical protein
MKRIVKKPVQVYRDGKYVNPSVGSVFDFTEAELSSIKSANPSALGHILEADIPVKVSVPVAVEAEKPVKPSKIPVASLVA